MDFHEHSSFTLCLSVCLFSPSLSFSVTLPITPPPTDGLLSQTEEKWPQGEDTDVSGQWKFFAICSRGNLLPDFNTAVLRKKCRPHMESIYRQQTFAVVFVVRCTFMSFISLLNVITYFRQAIAAVLSSTFIISDYLHIMGLKLHSSNDNAWHQTHFAQWSHDSNVVIRLASCRQEQ
jgi:hypothetical protein